MPECSRYLRAAAKSRLTSAAFCPVSRFPEGNELCSGSSMGGWAFAFALWPIKMMAGMVGKGFAQPHRLLLMPNLPKVVENPPSGNCREQLLSTSVEGHNNGGPEARSCLQAD